MGHLTSEVTRGIKGFPTDEFRGQAADDFGGVVVRRIYTEISNGASEIWSGIHRFPIRRRTSLTVRRRTSLTVQASDEFRGSQRQTSLEAVSVRRV